MEAQQEVAAEPAGDIPSPVDAPPDPVASAGVSISVTPDDTKPGEPETFTLRVKKFSGAYTPAATGLDGVAVDGKPIFEVVETFAGLTPSQDAIMEATKNSAHIVVTLEVVHKIFDSLTKTKLLRAMALRRGQIHDDFRALVEAAKYDPAADVAETHAEPTEGDTVQGCHGPTADEIKRKTLAAEVARDKLRVFASVGTSNGKAELGMRLAAMNRKQRQAFYASLKSKKSNKARVDQIRAKREKARAERKRGRR